MGSPWSDALTVVEIPRGREPKRVTIIWPYYEAPLFLMDQVATWWQWSEDLRTFVSIIVVDDGSPTPAPLLNVPVPCPVRLFRIEQDIPWNWLAARNIGAHHAEDGWLLLTDIDHVVPDETLRAVVFGRHDPSVVYAFSRREWTSESVHPHSASFLMTRQMFWTVGGYDERLSGVYGTDGAYRKRLMRTAPVQILTDELVRYEFVVDSSVSLDRKTPDMRAARADKFSAVTDGPPKTLSFPYHEVSV